MIRFPNRFHASETPGAGQIEPGYQDSAPHRGRTYARQVAGAKAPTYQFRELEQAWPQEKPMKADVK